MIPNRRTFTEFDTKKILSKYDIPVIEDIEVATANEAVLAAEKLGLPVVLKVSHPELTHKSDIGGVLLNVGTLEDVHAFTGRLLSLQNNAKVLVEKQADGKSADLIIGFKRDPIFGAVLMVGLGGIYAEIFADTSLYIGEINEKEAFKMLKRLKGFKILEGARGGVPLDTAGVIRSLLSLSKLASYRMDIIELDVNPLRVSEKNTMALDALALVETDQSKIDKFSNEQKDVDIHDRMKNLFRPESVAIVGASTTSEKAGNIIIKNLMTFGYKGKIYPVNPSGGLIENLQSRTSVSECPRPLDLAVLAIPYHQVETVMEDVAKAGTRHVIVASGGFSDAGSQGKLRENKLLDLCRKNRVNLMGPNSIGTIDSKYGFCTSIGKLPPMKPTGISIFGQSGTFSTGFSLEEITYHHRGFSKVACVGNKADVDESDFLEYYAIDPDTRSIGIYIEGVKHGPRFLRACKIASQNKPVVILKTGRTESGARAAASHTGTLAGSDAVYEAIFRQYGIQRVYDFVDFFNVLRAFDMCPIPAGNRIGVVSITGVGCVLTADACEEYGMALAPISDQTHKRLKALVPEWASIANPADIWSTIEQIGAFEAFRKMSEVMIEDKNVDILLVISVLLKEGYFDAGAAFAAIKANHPNKPILACYLGGWKDLLESFQNDLEEIGIPVLNSPNAAVKAASYLYNRKLIEDEMRDRR